MRHLFDSHVHFDGFGGVPGGSSAVIERAMLAGVRWMVAVGGSADANKAALEVSSRFRNSVWPAVGYDRHCAGCDCDLKVLAELATKGEGGVLPVAIGEIGLDFHYSPESAGEQQKLFASQLAIARDHELPVIVHTREADEETLSLLTRYSEECGDRNGRIGVLHCFAGDIKFARRVLDCGFHISFSGIATFRNAESVRDAIRIVPRERLLIETDSPFLAPVPNRGKPNEPANLCHVAEVVAASMGCPVEEVADIATSNAKRLFGIDDEP